jgi:RHS repeat-associated protein
MAFASDTKCRDMENSTGLSGVSCRSARFFSKNRRGTFKLIHPNPSQQPPQPPRWPPGGILGATIDPNGTGGYRVEADLNRDGKISLTDRTMVGSPRAAIPAGWISDRTGADNPVGYAGYFFSHETDQYCQRFRWYDPRWGRWMQRDPAGDVDGVNLYEYVGSNVVNYIDALGLQRNRAGSRPPPPPPPSNNNTPTPDGIRSHLLAGNYEFAAELLRQYNNPGRRALRQLVNNLARASEVLDEVFDKLSLELGAAFPITENGKCCKDGFIHDMKTRGTEVILGLKAEVGLGIKCQSKNKEPCPEAGMYYEADVGTKGKARLGGAGAEFEITGGFRVGPGGELVAMGTLKGQPKLPMNLNLSITSFVRGDSTGMQYIEQLSAELSFGGAIQVGSFRFYNIELTSTREPCSGG